MLTNQVSDFEQRMQEFEQKLSFDKNFDINCRKISFATRNAQLYFINGFIDSEAIENIIRFLYGISPLNFPNNLEDFSKLYIPYGSIGISKDQDTATISLLSGITCLFVEGFEHGITIDCRSYPSRGVAEPEKEKTLRGSKDGFVENIINNTALIRRRIRDPRLTMEHYQAGDCSHTDIVISYFSDRVDKTFLAELKKRITDLKVDSLTMSQESLAECIHPNKWYNPFPKFKYSERPDSTAAALLEGNIVILVDNSPSAMILPSSVFDIIEEIDDYYFPPIIGTYLRLTRLIITISTVFVTPIWLLLTMNPEWMPAWLDFTKITEPIHIPLYFQLIFLEFAIDGLKLAAVNTPSMLSTPLSVITALVLGEFSVKSGWFNSETMLYMAFVAVANYTPTSYELGYALKFMRMIILTMTALFNFWGFLAASLFTIFAVVSNKTIAGTSYIYPLFPFDWENLSNRFFRKRLAHSKKNQ